MRNRIALLAGLILLVASHAHAASVLIQADQAVYNIGDTVTLTVTATANSGETSTQVFGELLFSNPAMITNQASSQSALESFGGAIVWVLGTTPCAINICTAMNQIGGLTPMPVTNTPLVIATITFTLATVGTLDINWDPTTFDFFGAVNQPGTSVSIVPEPATGALLALGLLALAARGRNRRG